MGAADMQQNVRGALELFRREVRMAGYGMSAVSPATLPIVRVPAVGAGELYRVELYGNYNFVKSRVNADLATNQTVVPLQRYSAAACLPGTPAKAFTPGQRIAIESALLGVAEVRTISGYDAVNCNVTVTPALTNAYASGSLINEIQQVTYILTTGNVLQRAGVVVADQINTLQMAYILSDGTTVANPAAVLANLRSATLLLHAAMPEHNQLTPEAELQSEVRIRNLAIVRTPSLDIL
jgi:hypothetical protein